MISSVVTTHATRCSLGFESLLAYQFVDLSELCDLGWGKESPACINHRAGPECPDAKWIDEIGSINA
jgi:hypothetical protein